MRVLSLLIVTILFSNIVSSKEVLMATITNDEDAKYFRYFLTTNSQNEVTSFIKKGWQDIETFKRQPYRVSEIKYFKVPRGRNGTISLEQRQGKSVIKMRTENFDKRTGADLNLMYAYYGWDLNWDSYESDKHFKSKPIKLEKDDNERYFLSYNGKEFKYMHFKMRTDKRLFWGILPAGIKECLFSTTPFRK